MQTTALYVHAVCETVLHMGIDLIKTLINT